MKRFISLILALTLIAVSMVPISAQASENNLIELLEYSTVDNQGNNRIKFTNTKTISVSTPVLMPLRYIDILFLVSGGSPTSVKVRYNQQYTTLTLKQVTSGIYRAYGTITGEYADVFLQFNSSGSCVYDLMSCKVSAVTTSRSPVDADFTVNVDGDWMDATIGTPFELGGDDVSSAYNSYYQATITVSDITKFDKLHVQFASNYASIASVRVSYGSQTVPFEMNYIDLESNGTWINYFDNINSGYTVDSFGKCIAGITVDLSGIDRSKNYLLVIYFNGDFASNVGLYVNVSGIEGEVLFADTKDAGWWQWGKNMLNSLQALPERIAEELGKLYKPDEGKIESVQEQSQDLAEDRLGAVYQAGQVVDGLVGAFQNQTATEYLTVPVLTVPLGEVDWTIGGWEVQVVPDAFKPIVEILKTVIDIVCTLAFVKSMRARFERLLSGGNA